MVDCLQAIYGTPKLEDKLFIVSVSFPDNSNWTDIIQAETSEEAIKKVSDFYKSKEWTKDARVNNPKLFKPRFDGGEGFVKFITGRAIPDQYVSHCVGGGINLHIYRLSGYKECYGCGEVEEPQKNQSRLCKYGYIHDLKHNQQQLCGNTAHCAGEQAEP